MWSSDLIMSFFFAEYLLHMRVGCLFFGMFLKVRFFSLEGVKISI